jgi:protein phosphatase
MFESYGASDPGCVRSNNEDYYLVAPKLGLYVVADGMGGAQAGEVASKLAADTLLKELPALTEGQKLDEDSLTDLFHQANDRVREAANSDSGRQGMGTTLVAAVEKDDSLIIASVGDSRCYLYKDGKLEAVTEDQSWVNEVGRRLGMDEDQLKTHPMRHVLTMAIGASLDLRVNTYTVKPAPGNLILLCSDGLHGVTPLDEISKILADGGTLEQKCQSLIKAARDHGGPDNITAVVLKTAA